MDNYWFMSAEHTESFQNQIKNGTAHEFCRLTKAALIFRIITPPLDLHSRLGQVAP